MLETGGLACLKLAHMFLMNNLKQQGIEMYSYKLGAVLLALAEIAKRKVLMEMKK